MTKQVVRDAFQGANLLLPALADATVDDATATVDDAKPESRLQPGDCLQIDLRQYVNEMDETDQKVDGWKSKIYDVTVEGPGKPSPSGCRDLYSSDEDDEGGTVAKKDEHWYQLKFVADGTVLPFKLEPKMENKYSTPTRHGWRRGHHGKDVRADSESDDEFEYDSDVPGETDPGLQLLAKETNAVSLPSGTVEGPDGTDDEEDNDAEAELEEAKEWVYKDGDTGKMCILDGIRYQIIDAVLNDSGVVMCELLDMRDGKAGGGTIYRAFSNIKLAVNAFDGATNGGAKRDLGNAPLHEVLEFVCGGRGEYILGQCHVKLVKYGQVGVADIVEHLEQETAKGKTGAKAVVAELVQRDKKGDVGAGHALAFIRDEDGNYRITDPSPLRWGKRPLATAANLRIWGYLTTVHKRNGKAQVFNIKKWSNSADKDFEDWINGCKARKEAYRQIRNPGDLLAKLKEWRPAYDTYSLQKEWKLMEQGDEVGRPTKRARKRARHNVIEDDEED